MEKTKERNLFWKGQPIKSEEAHKLSVEEKVFLTGRKPCLEIKPKKEEKKNGSRRPNTIKRNKS